MADPARTSASKHRLYGLPVSMAMVIVFMVMVYGADRFNKKHRAQNAKCRKNLTNGLTRANSGSEGQIAWDRTLTVARQ